MGPIEDADDGHRHPHLSQGYQTEQPEGLGSTLDGCTSNMFYPVAHALMLASLAVKPMKSCPELRNNTPEMLVAAILIVRLAAVSHFDVLVPLSLAGRVRLHLCPMC